MPTFKARMFNALLRNRHLFQGKIKKDTFDMNTSIDAFRQECEKGAAKFGKIPEGISVEVDNLAGIKSEWINPENPVPEKLIFYVHGGGYVSGSCDDHRSIIAKLAENIGVTHFHYEYKLAPEFSAPNAVNDSVKIYQEVLSKGYRAENIVIMGESAGGGLALALLLALKDLGIALPQAAVAISPWTDLTCSSPSYMSKNKKSIAPMNSWTVFANYYVANNNPKDPLISPLFGDLRGLPPILVNSGEDDELYDDGRLFVEKAKSAGVDAKFTGGKSMVHCYPLLSPMFNEAKVAMDEITEFIKSKLYI